MSESNNNKKFTRRYKITKGNQFKKHYHLKRNRSCFCTLYRNKTGISFRTIFTQYTALPITLGVVPGTAGVLAITDITLINVDECTGCATFNITTSLAITIPGFLTAGTYSAITVIDCKRIKAAQPV